MTIRKHFALPLATLALAACATPGADTYPSLAIRDVERAKGEFEPVAAEQLDVPPVEVDAGADPAERLGGLVAQARQAHAAFMKALPVAERQVAAARGAAVASDAWATAQVALADLDSDRSDATIALGELDILYTAATVQAQDATAIEAARSQVVALIGEEDSALERLRAQVR